MQRLLTLTLAVAVLGACARPPPTCSDGRRNGQEADVDCGGPDCSACGLTRACETQDDCESGRCQLHACVPANAPCMPPTSPCGAACVDLRLDPSHCGVCGRACAASERCEAGTCRAAMCPPGTIPCGQGPSFACVASNIDVLHCGGCSTVCAPGERCVAGVCQSGCTPSQRLCAGQCVSTMTDVLHCSGCGMPCAPGELCAMGMCRPACAPPAVVCDGGFACVDVRFDPMHCGACGAACPLPPRAGPLCLNQVCGRTACQPGFDDCNGLLGDGCEAELAVDAMNCGACGRACSPCMNGMCP